MEPCVIVASCSSSVRAEDFVKGILETIGELPEPLLILDGIRCYPWTIKTKYYEANVQLCALDHVSVGNQTFADSVNAVILCFDSSKKNNLEVAEQWVDCTKDMEVGVRILICDKCFTEHDNQNLSEDEKGISRLEAQDWCISNGFELVELDPEMDCDCEVDDIPESVGMKRVIQALEVHMWPNLVLKDCTACVAPVQAFSNGVDGICRPLSTIYATNRLSDTFTDNRSLEHLPEHPIGPRTSKLVAAVKPIQQSSGTNVATVSPTLLGHNETDDQSHHLSSNNVPIPTASVSPLIRGAHSLTTREQIIPAPSEPTSPPTRDERIDAVLEAMDSMSEETFDGLFQNLNDIKLKAQSLSPDQRRVYAEKMAVAFWKSLGGNDSEIEDISED